MAYVERISTSERVPDDPASDLIDAVSSPSVLRVLMHEGILGVVDAWGSFEATEAGAGTGGGEEEEAEGCIYVAY